MECKELLELAGASNDGAALGGEFLGASVSESSIEGFCIECIKQYLRKNNPTAIPHIRFNIMNIYGL
jgi:hypothetical protein